jgi:hypothetical protein
MWPGTYVFYAYVCGYSDSSCEYWTPYALPPLAFTVNVVAVDSVGADENPICAGGGTSVYAPPDPSSATYPSGSPTFSEQGQVYLLSILLDAVSVRYGLRHGSAYPSGSRVTW